MLTINADRHPLMRRMHKPGPTRPADDQDKRSVVVVELRDTDEWLNGSAEEAEQLLVSPLVDVMSAEPLSFTGDTRSS